MTESLLLMFSLALAGQGRPAEQLNPDSLYRKENLVAWCIVPFDAKKRTPAQRAEMLKRLGFQKFAYDWRDEHIPTFDEEIAQLKKQGIELTAFWFPGGLNSQAKKILEALERNQVRTQLWISMGDPAPGKGQPEKLKAIVEQIRPIAAAAKKIGCSVGLYNHGGWFGEPENQAQIMQLLNEPNVGIVYNLHHGHDHLERFTLAFKKIQPWLFCVNINGMDAQGDKTGRKILQLGQGEKDLELLQAILKTGYKGPIGILGHTQHDAGLTLHDNLDGLAWLVKKMKKEPAGAKPVPRTPVPNRVAPPPPKPLTQTPPPAFKEIPYNPQMASALLAEAKEKGDSANGARVFASAKYACVSCHKVGAQGGQIGPELTAIATCIQPQEIVEGLLWPSRQIKDEYKAWSLVTSKGKFLQGYKLKDNGKEIVLKEASTSKEWNLNKDDIEEMKEVGSLMPVGIAEAMTPIERRDLVKFLLDLGKDPKAVGLMPAMRPMDMKPATFTYLRDPLEKAAWPSWESFVNRERLYDFYFKQAAHFASLEKRPLLVEAFPGLDMGKHGHWGNQNEETWKSSNWNKADLGRVLSGVFRGPGVMVPRAVCVLLGDQGEMAVCFNPETLNYETLWQGGFLSFSNIRHGFMDGLRPVGTILPLPSGRKLDKPFTYHGFYRHGNRVIFAYSIDGVEYLDSPWVREGKYHREVAPRKVHSLAPVLNAPPMRFPQKITGKISLGKGSPYAIDTIEVPFENPWKAPFYPGDLAFLANGAGLVCTMQGDVWRVDGLEPSSTQATWKKVASGMHQALGMVVHNDAPYVLGRDQITRLHDLNNDGEYDFHECFCNAYKTSPSGHDFLCGLVRASDGSFYFASSNQGAMRVSPDGKKAESLATGFRNPDGIGLTPEGKITIPCSEGDWTPSSMICQVKEGGFFGSGGPKNGAAPDLPLVYLPRGLDNSAGGQATVTSDQWGPLKNQMIHFSFGACSHMLLLRDEVKGKPQGAIVLLPGEFLSGAHRGKFSPTDGQLYVAGMQGWGTYAMAEGSFQRVRYTGAPVQLPVAIHSHANGVYLRFSSPVDASLLGKTTSRLAMAWNYRYSAAYGSAEYSPSHFGLRGHDLLDIPAAHVLEGGKAVFLEIPDLQPVNQLLLRLQVGPGAPVNLIATVHELDNDFTAYPSYKPVKKAIHPHPIQSDLAFAIKTLPNKWKYPIGGTRALKVEAGPNLSFIPNQFKVKKGELLALTFHNPDVVPHNLAILKPGKLPVVGQLANALISDPEAIVRHYVPNSPDVFVHTDVVMPSDKFTIYFKAPDQPGNYPMVCTFPGHWMAMNGLLQVE
ncbi:MAG: c-type cytochrome [Gemmataceae bacterium]|nr:c-type cytochrome [Gemmataceae bacterium]